MARKKQTKRSYRKRVQRYRKNPIDGLKIITSGQGSAEEAVLEWATRRSKKADGGVKYSGAAFPRQSNTWRLLKKSKGGFAEKTKANVDTADATIILIVGDSEKKGSVDVNNLPTSPQAPLAARFPVKVAEVYAEAAKKPFIYINVSNPDAAAKRLKPFVGKYKTLNIIGTQSRVNKDTIKSILSSALGYADLEKQDREAAAFAAEAAKQKAAEAAKKAPKKTKEEKEAAAKRREEQQKRAEKAKAERESRQSVRVVRPEETEEETRERLERSYQRRMLAKRISAGQPADRISPNLRQSPPRKWNILPASSPFADNNNVYQLRDNEVFVFETLGSHKGTPYGETALYRYGAIPYKVGLQNQCYAIYTKKWEKVSVLSSKVTAKWLPLRSIMTAFARLAEVARLNPQKVFILTPMLVKTVKGSKGYDQTLDDKPSGFEWDLNTVLMFINNFDNQGSPLPPNVVCSWVKDPKHPRYYLPLATQFNPFFPYFKDTKRFSISDQKSFNAYTNITKKDKVLFLCPSVHPFHQIVNFAMSWTLAAQPKEIVVQGIGTGSPLKGFASKLTVKKYSKDEDGTLDKYLARLFDGVTVIVAPLVDPDLSPSFSNGHLPLHRYKDHIIEKGIPVTLFTWAQGEPSNNGAYCLQFNFGFELPQIRKSKPKEVEELSQAEYDYIQSMVAADVAKTRRQYGMGLAPLSGPPDFEMLQRLAEKREKEARDPGIRSTQPNKSISQFFTSLSVLKVQETVQRLAKTQIYEGAPPILFTLRSIRALTNQSADEGPAVFGSEGASYSTMADLASAMFGSGKKSNPRKRRRTRR